MSTQEGSYRTLNNSMALRSNIVGYCRKHRVHLTGPQVTQKQCVQKHCRALKKWDCGFWEHKQRLKDIRQMKKEAGIPSWQKVEIRTDRNGELLPPKLKEKR